MVRIVCSCRHFLELATILIKEHVAPHNAFSRRCRHFALLFFLRLRNFDVPGFRFFGGRLFSCSLFRPVKEKKMKRREMIHEELKGALSLLIAKCTVSV